MQTQLIQSDGVLGFWGLMGFDWPGNVRELENEMERAVAMAGGREDIAREFLSEKIAGSQIRPQPEMSGVTAGALKDAVHQIEERMIRDALEKTDGNRSQAAKLLGLSRQGLLNKIGAYDVQL